MQNSIKEHGEGLAGWRIWRDWRKAFAAHLFPTDASLEWWIRKHRDKLIASGQFIPRLGRGGSIVGPDIDNVVIGIMRGEAADEDAAA